MIGVKNFIIAGGGTGGHIFPAVAIANAIKKLSPHSKILFIGAKGKMEMEKVPLEGYEIKGLTIAGFNRSSIVKNLTLPYKLIKSFFQVSGIFKKFKPDAVIGVGGYSTFPVLRFAQSKGIPTFIHEANSYAGKTNILLSKKAKIVFTASDGMEKFFPAEKILVSGNPVRKVIVETKADKSESLKIFGLSPNKKTVLVIGGSLGSKSINEAVYENIESFGKHNLQLIWQTGNLFVEKAVMRCKKMAHVSINAFIAKMENAYAAADIVVSRSGAMSIAELCIVKKPVIFVPYPFAAENHQYVNAFKLVQKNAAKIVEDRDVMKTLIPEIVQLSEDETEQKKLTDNIAQLAVVNADSTVAVEILKHLN